MNNPLPINPGGTGDPLAALRAYHMPDPVGWWPPAPGWWLLLFLLSAGVGISVWWITHRHTGSAAARHARRELRRLRRELANDSDSAHFTRQLSKLLRRFALAVFPRHQVAALTGEDWLRFLDTHGGNGRFCDGPGRQLLDQHHPGVFIFLGTKDRNGMGGPQCFVILRQHNFQ